MKDEAKSKNFANRSIAYNQHQLIMFSLNVQARRKPIHPNNASTSTLIVDKRCSNSLRTTANVLDTPIKYLLNSNRKNFKPKNTNIILFKPKNHRSSPIKPKTRTIDPPMWKPRQKQKEEKQKYLIDKLMESLLCKAYFCMMSIWLAAKIR